MKLTLSFFSILLFISATLNAQIKLPALIRDSMILQRDMKINIWGWASPSEKVEVKFNNKTYRTRADVSNGEWSVQLNAMKAGGPYTMTITSLTDKVILHDILIGDVWFCSGQSNMVHQVKLHSVYYPDAIPNAHYPEIRQFWVPNVTNLQGPQNDLPFGYWKSANPADVQDFSAVAYFFAKALYEKYHVPIGIINASWGGVPIEAFMSADALKDFPSIMKTVDRNKDTAFLNSFRRRNFRGNMGIPRPQDKGLTGPIPWYDPSYVPTEWRRIGIPGYWEDQGLKNLNGVVWYRKEIDVPQSMIGKSAKVFLGRIVDADALYINGRQVGNTTYQYPQRRYTVPDDLLKPGKNLFVIRVTNNFGKGGFVPDKPYELIAGDDTVDLKGYWQYKVGEVFIPRQRFGAGGFGFAPQNAPTSLYNAMVAPEIDYTIKGFVWYQGESNAGNAAEYSKLQPAMIEDWRAKWKEGNIPFLYVQLPGFGDYDYLPSDGEWAELRNSQLKSLALPNTAMAVAIDLGEWNDIHPDRKKPVGNRLALAAEKLAYGENIVYSGPLYNTSKIDSDSIIISFTHTGTGLIFKSADDSAYTSPLPGDVEGGFTIAGADKKYVWANAKIEGDKVIVWSDEVKDPKYVRYAWADNPVNPNLYNKEDLPASPFETE